MSIIRFTSIPYHLLAAVLGLCSFSPAVVALPDLDQHPGKAIYTKLCLDCHGAKGEGDDSGEVDPLEGSRDIASLAGKIERTMPEDKEHLCVGEDAKQVAEYIYHAFYSVEARARNNPLRVELQRLTVPQYQASVADLIGSFRGENHRWVGKERGLHAEYFGERGFNSRKEFREQKKPDQFKRTDPVVKFDFGSDVPKFDPQMNFKKEEFSVRWNAILLPPETGEYEFVIRTRNGVELFVNDRDQRTSKTIDGYVAPNNEIREVKGKKFLIGGRFYPLVLEFFKYKSDKAMVELLWKPPHGALEVIPASHLSPGGVDEEFVVEIPFPADDRSVGYERGTAVSRAWLDAVAGGAMEAAEYVSDNLDQLAKLNDKMPEKERRDKAWKFCAQFIERAFRRPQSDQEKERIISETFEGSASLQQGVKRVVLLTLQDPRFLYPAASEIPGKTDGWDRASRLALAMWDSLPPQEYREVAGKGKLNTPEEVENMAWWALENPRTKAKLRGFFHHWLEMERAANITKDSQKYPEFDESVVFDLRTSLTLFLEDVIYSEKSDFRELLNADYIWMNERLAKIYAPPGTKVEPGKFTKVKLEGNRRSGVITHPFLLSSLAYHNSTSPIHRGVFLTRNIVGMSLNSPEMANEFVEGKFDPKLTMREKVEELTRAKACMACHTTINPLGFSLEHFDAIGRWQTTDKNKPINPSSEFRSDSGEVVYLTGPGDVAKFAAGNESAHRAFIEQLFHHMVKQPMLAYGNDVPDRLLNDFKSSGFNIKVLIVKIAKIAAIGPNQI